MFLCGSIIDVWVHVIQMNGYMRSKVWDEITDSYPNSNGAKLIDDINPPCCMM